MTQDCPGLLSAPSHWQGCCGALHVWLRLPWSVEFTDLTALLDSFVNNQKPEVWHLGFGEFLWHGRWAG